MISILFSSSMALPWVHPTGYSFMAFEGRKSPPEDHRNFLSLDAPPRHESNCESFSLLALHALSGPTSIQGRKKYCSFTCMITNVNDAVNRLLVSVQATGIGNVRSAPLDLDKTYKSRASENFSSSRARDIHDKFAPCWRRRIFRKIFHILNSIIVTNSRCCSQRYKIV